MDNSATYHWRLSYETHENSKNPTKTQMNDPKNVLNPAETSPK